MTATGGGGGSSSNTIAKKKEVMKHTKENQFLVQVGANDGTRESELVYEMLKNDTTRAILVEGNPTVFKLLEQNIEKMYKTAKGRIVPLNVLVCEDGKNMTFHMVNSHRIIKLFPDPPHWAIWQLSSLDRKSTADGLRTYFSWKQNIPILKENNLTLDDFIIPKDIPCTSFANILKKGGFHNPRDVDVLSVDVEGYDGFVVLDALQTPNFKPNKIVFEVKVMKRLFPNVYVQVIEELHKNGYETGCNDTETSQKFVCPPGGDLTATLKN